MENERQHMFDACFYQNDMQMCEYLYKPSIELSYIGNGYKYTVEQYKFLINYSQKNTLIAAGSVPLFHAIRYNDFKSCEYLIHVLKYSCDDDEHLITMAMNRGYNDIVKLLYDAVDPDDCKLYFIRHNMLEKYGDLIKIVNK